MGTKLMSTLRPLTLEYLVEALATLRGQFLHSFLVGRPIQPPLTGKLQIVNNSLVFPFSQILVLVWFLTPGADPHLLSLITCEPTG